MGGPPINEIVSGYWEQAFTTLTTPTIATLDFDWNCTAISITPTLNAQIFIDTAPGAPINEVWNSGAITGTTTWASVTGLDVIGTVNEANTYYLKIALRDTTLAKNDGNDMICYDNIIINYGTISPTFTMEFDFATTQSSVVPTWLAVPPYYDIDHTGAVDGDWVFLSFPITATGDVDVVFDDAVFGDGGTVWDVILWYDASDVTGDHWKSYNYAFAGTQDMPSIGNQMGFWIHLTDAGGGADDTALTVGMGAPPSPGTTIWLESGWNMIGWASPTDGTYSLTDLRNDNFGFGIINVEMFDAGAAPYYMQDMLAGEFFFQGQAYWVWVDVAGLLTLP